MSAIVTILGLLIVVSFIANYLATVLPAQMRVNDANHALLVENQVGRLAAQLESASRPSAIGSVSSQPLSLGSEGLPPFAGPDPASVTPGSSSSSFVVNFSLSGPVRFTLPGGWPNGGNLYCTKKLPAGEGCPYPSNCNSTAYPNPNPPTVICSGSPVLVYNFTNGSHWINAVGGANFTLGYTTNWSTVEINSTGGTYVGNVNISGNHDTISFVYQGNYVAIVNLTGNFDNLTLSGPGGGTVYLFLVGNNDHVSWSGNGASSLHVTAYGQYDSVATTKVQGSTTAYVNYIGFDASNASSASCPYGNSALTDTLSGAGGVADFYLTNNTTGKPYPTYPPWITNYTQATNLTCPYFKSIGVPFKNQGAVAGAFVVHLSNRYGPAADVAFDEGAVILAQAGGLPVMIDGPAITYSLHRMSIWIPQFSGTVGVAEGVGTASLSLRLTSIFSVSLPSNGFSLGSKWVNITVHSPYAAAWTSYFNAQPGFAGDASCVGPVAACSGPFTFNGPVGTVHLNIPIAPSPYGTSFHIVVARFAVSLT